MGENLLKLFIRQRIVYRLQKIDHKEKGQMTYKYMKKYSTYLAIKEMQIKMMLRFYLTPVRMVK
jgi:hypothetical protein